MHFRRGMDGSGGSEKIRPSTTQSISVSEPLAYAGSQSAATDSSAHFQISDRSSTHVVSSISISTAQQALLNAGIHLDNARATLQILNMPEADRRAILYDVARSLRQAENELDHSYHGSISRDGDGKTATYDYQKTIEGLAEMRKTLMREMHNLSPAERIPIMTLLNPPFEQII